MGQTKGTLDCEERIEVLNYLFTEDDLFYLFKIYKDKRRKEENKRKIIYGYIFSELPYEHLINEMKRRIESDANEICNLVKKFLQKPLNVDTTNKLDMDAFDSVSCFNYDPVRGTGVYKDLYGKRGVYIFVMDDDYPVPSDFGEATKCAPLRRNVTNFHKGEILYIGKTQSMLTRMHEHFSSDNERRGTGSIKLGSVHRSGLKEMVLVYAFQINKTYRQLYEMIGGTIEDKLHENFKDYILGNK